MAQPPKAQSIASTLATGILHGCSGSGHLLGVMPALTMPTWRVAVTCACPYRPTDPAATPPGRDPPPTLERTYGTRRSRSCWAYTTVPQLPCVLRPRHGSGHVHLHGCRRCARMPAHLPMCLPSRVPMRARPCARAHARPPMHAPTMGNVRDGRVCACSGELSSQMSEKLDDPRTPGRLALASSLFALLMGSMWTVKAILSFKWASRLLRVVGA